MMTELWWKVFLASIVIVIACKIFQAPWGGFLVFSAAFLGCTVLLFAAMLIVDPLLAKLKKKKDDKNP